MAHTEVDFTYDQAIRTLGVTPEKLDRLIDEGALPVINTGAQTLIPRESILGYLATVTSVGKEKKKAAPPAKEPPAAKAAPAPRAEAPAAEASAATPEAAAPAEPEATAAPADELAGASPAPADIGVPSEAPAVETPAEPAEAVQAQAEDKE